MSQDSKKPLDVGMLLLDDEERPTIWTVVSARTIVAHYGSCSAKATLRGSGLPHGWRIVNNQTLAKHLRDVFASAATNQQEE